MSTTTPISLYDLQRRVQATLRGGMDSSYWVVAEISEIKLNSSGHCYLTLIEKSDDNRMVRARANAMIWSSRYSDIVASFSSATGQMLSAGQKVLVRAEVVFHEVYGYSINILNIDPSYTLGDIEKQRKETILRLEQEGLYTLNKQVPYPDFVQRIAIISSEGAAGYQDFCNEIASHPYIFYLKLYNATMQGNGAEASILAALGQIGQSAEEFDVVVIIRGGGAQNDLLCFDSYGLASAVALMPLPVVIGIGHDKDISVLDLIAAISLKTPTAVARFLIDGMVERESWLNEMQQYLADFLASALLNEEQRIDRYSTTLKSLVAETINNQTIKLNQLSSQLSAISVLGIERAEAKLTLLRELLERKAKEHISYREGQINHMLASLSGFDPNRILKLGYAIARIEGRALRMASDATVGKNIELRITDAEITAKIESIKKITI